MDDVWYDITPEPDPRKAAEVLLKLNAKKIIDELSEDLDADIIYPLLEEAHRIAPDRGDIALSMLSSYLSDAQFAKVLQGLSEDCANAVIREQEYGRIFEINLDTYGYEEEDGEFFKLVYLLLLDFFDKYEPDGYYRDMTKQLILSVYQFGVYLVNHKFEHFLPELQNDEVAKAFAQKYNLPLLNKPFDYTLKYY